MQAATELQHSDWIEIGRLEDIPRRGARVVDLPAGRVAVFRTADEEVFALRDRCPHRGGPLSQGIVHGRKVTCPLHDWKIHLDTGRAAAPDEGCAARFPVRAVDGRVWLSACPEMGSESAGIEDSDRRAP
ncbi:MAG: nitrite reductase small subunit NirD [Gammaproteobacteria bacterium]|nr:nitrite reductase small subunit NirD [Gammaproteobacteria bacterium]NIR97086.1 nitrite reductase small subunit NirD [Gammaproteobacteria bacterium]NIT62788.1 nitrite reductase small subunit NirD [Gammaproteobacteria bacterium]NIV19751.1 nitrite reductase small subunit NirD [Gammaproteobacteria bacterium]NIX11175.1 nitrite reductase small subunit NirD [Gammaproteobacteria bacterium]